MTGEMNYSIRDIYPNWGGLETSTKVAPDSDNQKAMNEDATVSDAQDLSADTPQDKKGIFLCLGVAIALIVFFGGAR